MNLKGDGRFLGEPAPDARCIRERRLKRSLLRQVKPTFRPTLSFSWSTPSNAASVTADHRNFRTKRAGYGSLGGASALNHDLTSYRPCSLEHHGNNEALDESGRLLQRFLSCFAGGFLAADCRRTTDVPSTDAFASACSTRRRIASDNVGSSGCALAHSSIRVRNTGEARMPTMGVTPVAGRPLLFCLAGIDRVIFFV